MIGHPAHPTLQLFGYTMLVLAGVLLCQRLGVRGSSLTAGYFLVIGVLTFLLVRWAVS